MGSNMIRYDDRATVCGRKTLRIRLLLTALIAVMFFLVTKSSYAERSDFIELSLLSRFESRYGKEAKARLEQLVDLLDSEISNESELVKLERVNEFFNRVPFIDDQTHWKIEDYWASPLEKLATNGGDCEDFSVAKYFALKKLGVAEAKLRLTYVKSIPLNQAHMVMIYFPEPDAVPLVLDNLNPKILPANLRTDLIPVYSFNGGGLWLAKARGTGKRIGDAEKVAGWKDLVTRMDGLDL